MEANKKNIKDFLYTPNRYFIIPDFQRPYSWDEVNVNAFLEDLEKTRETGRKHYFGSIVYIGGANESTIIDGQQRATTVLLFITAMYHIVDNEPEKSALPALQIKKEFLYNEFGDETNRIKLRAVTIDDQIFKKIFNKEDLDQIERDSKLNKSYLKFYNYLKDKNDLHEYLEALADFEIVDILIADTDDNPQKIFESINSTGKPLSDGDKIRNFALMLNDEGARSLVFEKYWKKIESELSVVDKDFITEFFKSFLTVKLSREVKSYNVYSEFKSVFENQFAQDHSDLDGLREFYDQVIDSLEHFSFLKFNRSRDGKYDFIKEEGFRNNYLSIEVTFPFLTKVLERHFTGELTQVHVKEVFDLVEAFLIRRTLCGIATTGLNKTFASLDKDVKNLMSEDPIADYGDVLKFVLLEKQKAQRTPRDTELFESIATSAFYEQSKINVKFVLSSIDDKTQSRESFLLRRFEEGDKTLTIEHIMPQTLTESWKTELGPNYAEIHETYLHTLANLTITGYNSKYSNRSFSDKKSIENGFLQSPLTINSFVKEKDTWSEKELEARKIWWQEHITKIWPLPKTNFKPPSNTKIISLSSEESLIGREIRSVTVLNEYAQVTTWVEAFDFIAETLYDTDQQLFAKVASNDVLSRFIRFGAAELRGPVEIYETGYYIETHLHNDRKRIVLTKLMELLELDPASIEFEVTKQKRKSGNDQSEYQLKFWDVFTQALQISKNDIFTGVPSPRAQHWLNIPIGTSKAHVEMTIVQNPQKFVGVELYISNNSPLFNHLHENKEAIETQLGEALIWDEIPDKKASRIKLRKEADYIESLLNDDDRDLKEIIDWMVSKANQFSEVFIKYI